MISRDELQNKYSFLNPTPITDGLMAFGFECGDGWLPLLAKMFEDIDNVLSYQEKENFRFTQIKEKFGGLRAYYEGGNNQVSAIVDKAEQDSYNTCEQCGINKGVKQTKGWVVSLCKKCMKKYEEKRKCKNI